MDPVLHLRNHTLGAVHERTCFLYSRVVPRYLRIPIECALLMSALLMIFIWIYVHLSFFKSAGNCFEGLDMPQGPPTSQIISVQMFWNSTEKWVLVQGMERTSPPTDEPDIVPVRDKPKPKENELGTSQTDISMSDAHVCTGDPKQTPMYGVNCSDPIGGSAKCGDTRTTCWENSLLSFTKLVALKSEQQCNVEKSKANQTSHKKARLSEDDEMREPETSLLDRIGRTRLLRVMPEYLLMEFSQQPGYLSLSKADRRKFNITSKIYTVDLNNVTCFGGMLGQFLHYYLLGFETTLINSFTYIMENTSQRAYVRNALTGEYYHLKVMWLGRTRYILALMPLLFFTMIASALFRQSQYQIFKLIFVFRHVAMHEELPFAMSAIGHMPLLTMTYACVGLMVVMSEVLTDSGVFCMFMLFTVWISDQYYAIFCNSDVSKKYWPGFFYLYHFIPYAFYVRMNGIFWMLPFAVHVCLLQHSMLHFFHHYELPRYEVRNDGEGPLFQGVNDFGVYIVTFFRHIPPVGWLGQVLYNREPREDEHREPEEDEHREMPEGQQPQDNDDTGSEGVRNDEDDFSDTHSWVDASEPVEEDARIQGINNDLPQSHFSSHSHQHSHHDSSISLPSTRTSPLSRSPLYHEPH